MILVRLMNVLRNSFYADDDTCYKTGPAEIVLFHCGPCLYENLDHGAFASRAVQRCGAFCSRAGNADMTPGMSMPWGQMAEQAAQPTQRRGSMALSAASMS